MMEFSGEKKPQGPSSYDLRMWAVGFCELLDDHVRSPSLGHHGPGNESHGNMEKYGKIPEIAG
jgi:hypothetical protein